MRTLRIDQYKTTKGRYLPPNILIGRQVPRERILAMIRHERRIVCAMLALLLMGLLGAASAQEPTRAITDSAGRRVELPQRISRVLAAGPPASILLYTLAPEKMIGWVRTPGPAEKAFLLESVRDLPEYGRLTGRGNTANLENVLKFKPDLIIDVGSVGPTYVSLANSVQDQTKIPYVLLDGTFNKTPEMYRLLGNLLGVEARAEQLARYADETLNGLGARIASIPEAERPRVYYGRGVNGLETGLAGSINMEVLERVGAINVAASAGTGGITKVSIEQVLSWNPDVILALEPAFYGAVATDPAVGLGQGRPRQAHLSVAQSALRVVRRTARCQPADRRTLADGDPLSQAVSRGPARSHPRFLQAVLPGRSQRAAIGHPAHVCNSLEAGAMT